MCNVDYLSLEELRKIDQKLGKILDLITPPALPKVEPGEQEERAALDEIIGKALAKD